MDDEIVAEVQVQALRCLEVQNLPYAGKDAKSSRAI